MSGAVYQDLCQSLSLEPISQLSAFSEFNAPEMMGNKSKSEILAASLSAMLELILEDENATEVIDRELIDRYILKINSMINQTLNSILHHPEFQALESTWRGLEYLLQYAPSHKNIKVDLLDVSQSDLAEDFEESVDISQSGLYEQVYKQEYDMPGGQPFGAMIAAYEFDHGAESLSLLKQVAKVASYAQCPFITAASERFFQKSHFSDVMMMEEIGAFLEKSDYIAWQQFRETDEARYLGLTLPKFMLRLPYQKSQFNQDRFYREFCSQHSDFLWGNAAFSFGANILKSFIDSGWAVNIRGPESGGKVFDLPMHHFNVGHGLQTKIPIETLIPESRELALANQGFIPLCYYKNSDFACYFSANSFQKPRQFLEEEDTANSRVNARLPYVFLASRIAHYLKVLQRENIGAAKDAKTLERELNKWLKTLVTSMPNPSPELIATHPLNEAYVEVGEQADNPGYYNVKLFISPHFQVEGIDVMLSLVASMPGDP